MFKEICGNLFDYYMDDDNLIAMAMGIYVAANKNKKPNNVRLNASSDRRVTKEGRRVFDQIKEQAEDVEYEDI